MKSILTNAFQIRNDSDYKDFFIAGNSEAQEQINNAEYFLGEIIKFIKLHYKVDV